MSGFVRRSLAVTRHEMSMLRRDAAPLVALVLMPLLVIAFLQPAARTMLAEEGYRGANGSEQAVPGLTVMFAFFVVSFGGLMFFREHGWGTWHRLLVSGVRVSELLIGKLTPLVLLLLGQFVTVFTVSGLLFGFRLRGSVLAVVLVWAALALCLVALTSMMFALSRTDQQMIAMTNVVTMLCGGFGGAFVPVEALPGWANTLAPAVPSYWAIDGFRAVALDGGGVADVLMPVGALLAFAAVFGIVAGLRFRADDQKTSLRN